MKIKLIAASSIFILSVFSTVFTVEGAGVGIPAPGPGAPGPGGPTGPRPPIPPPAPKPEPDAPRPGPRPEVMSLQRALKEKGFNPGAVDGVLGPKTKSAIKSFQKSAGLEQSGEDNKQTREKLGIK